MADNESTEQRIKKLEKELEKMEDRREVTIQQQRLAMLYHNHRSVQAIYLAAGYSSRQAASRALNTTKVRKYLQKYTELRDLQEIGAGFFHDHYQHFISECRRRGNLKSAAPLLRDYWDINQTIIEKDERVTEINLNYQGDNTAPDYANDEEDEEIKAHFVGENVIIPGVTVDIGTKGEEDGEQEA